MTDHDYAAISGALQLATDALQAGDVDRVRTWARWADTYATDAYRAERGLPAVTA